MEILWKPTLLLTALLTAALAAPAEAAKSRPTYSKDIAPILSAKCVKCHRPNEIAPMSLRSYEEVRPWAKAIRKKVREREMPPWHADPGYGPWKNDRSLSDEEKELITRWVKIGAPQGDKKDLPPALPEASSGWRFGEPDYIIEFDEVAVPAGGRDQFYDHVVETNLDEDRWITAVEILPGSRKVVHHVILWQGGVANQEGWIGAWAAGTEPFRFPDGTGRLLKKGTDIIGDMHYHPTDTAEKDRTRVGLHFADVAEDIEKELVNLWVMNAEFEIPPGDPNYEARSSFTFAQDSHIWSLAPHMHYRGKDFTYTATFPDGTREELLKVSAYDFNWQTFYEFEEPLAVPAGTRIDCVAHWDNSAKNESNPDPTKTVRFGNESYDEMMIGFVDYTVDEGIRPEKRESPVLAKMEELAEKFPGQVFNVPIQMDPGTGLEPSAVHLPPEGEGGWYVRVGSIAGKARITDITWDGVSFKATALIPGEDPTPLSGSIDGDTLSLIMGPPDDDAFAIKGTLVK